MGAGQSSSHPSRALHVLRVTPSSPASQTTIEPFFDFVVGFEGDSLTSQNNIDVSQIETIVESHEGRVLNLLVWNSKSQETRVVPIIPSRSWSMPHSDVPNPKEPEPVSQPSLLGLSMRMCQPEFSMDNVWHVLDVIEGSPAESAGLVPYGDWIIGWSGGVLSAEGDFYDLVEAHIDKPLRVYVYSYDFDTLREVVLVPNRQWGGEGLLGCVFGFGLLHRIPPQPADRQPGIAPTTPPELQDPDEYDEEQELFVPADIPDGFDESRNPQAGQREREESFTRYPTSHSYGNSNYHGSGGGEEPNLHPFGSPTHEQHRGHGHNHDHQYDGRSSSDGTPHRTAAWAASSASASTPRGSRAFGVLMNGTGTAHPHSPDTARTPVPFRKSVHPYASNNRKATNRYSDESGDDGDDDYDGETSVAGTETTELESDTNSLGSLTSVD